MLTEDITNGENNCKILTHDWKGTPTAQKGFFYFSAAKGGKYMVKYAPSRYTWNPPFTKATFHRDAVARNVGTPILDNDGKPILIGPTESDLIHVNE
jgi:hypothetical protein